MKKLRKVDWVGLATTRFKPKVIKNSIDVEGSCGTHALYCLTGNPILEISKSCPKKVGGTTKLCAATLKKWVMK